MTDDKAWIGVDFDGTLVRYDPGQGNAIGAPIAPMVDRVKAWLRSGKYKVKIFTARAGAGDDRYRAQQALLVRRWCLQNLGEVLEVTATKDYDMIELWDDRAIGVVPNEGLLVEDLAHELAAHGVLQWDLRPGNSRAGDPTATPAHAFGVVVAEPPGSLGSGTALSAREARVWACRLWRAANEIEQAAEEGAA